MPLPNKLKKNLKSYFNLHKYELTSKLMNNQPHHHHHHQQQQQQQYQQLATANCTNTHSPNSLKINEMYINSVINLYNLNTNSLNNTNSLSNLSANNKSLKQNYKTSKYRNHNNHPQRSLTSTIATFNLNSDCSTIRNSRKTCSLM